MICFGLLVMFCQPQAPLPVPDTYCQIARPIYWSAADTRETKEQIDTENRKWKRFCKVNQK
jgi:hypothetical protein